MLIKTKVEIEIEIDVDTEAGEPETGVKPTFYVNDIAIIDAVGSIDLDTDIQSHIESVIGDEVIWELIEESEVE